MKQLVAVEEFRAFKFALHWCRWRCVSPARRSLLPWCRWRQGWLRMPHRRSWYAPLLSSALMPWVLLMIYFPSLGSSPEHSSLLEFEGFARRCWGSEVGTMLWSTKRCHTKSATHLELSISPDLRFPTRMFGTIEERECQSEFRTFRSQWSTDLHGWNQVPLLPGAGLIITKRLRATYGSTQTRFRGCNQSINIREDVLRIWNPSGVDGWICLAKIVELDGALSGMRHIKTRWW